MFYGRILDSNKMKLVPKAIPVVSFICSNEGFKHSAHERDRFKCWPILGPCYGKAKAYGRSFCPVGEQQRGATEHSVLGSVRQRVARRAANFSKSEEASCGRRSQQQTTTAHDSPVGRALLRLSDWLGI